jgi:hypothetical protein
MRQTLTNAPLVDKKVLSALQLYQGDLWRH